jgi:hypothetical protein
VLYVDEHVTKDKPRKNSYYLFSNLSFVRLNYRFFREGCIISSHDLKQNKWKLDTAGGVVFFGGAALIKIQLALPPPFSVIINSIALGLYSIGYVLWLIESLLLPKRTHSNEAWHAVNAFKKQFTAASIIGLIATMCGIASIFFPLLIIPTCWIFMLSNACWVIGEYQKTASPPKDDPAYQHQKQLAYYQYVQVIAIISLTTAIITTVSFFFPPFIWAAVIVAPILSLLALKTWFDAHLVNYAPKSPQKHESSYESMNHLVQLAPKPTPTENCATAQNSVTSLVPQPIEKLNDNSSHSCQQTYQRQTP